MSLLANSVTLTWFHAMGFVVKPCQVGFYASIVALFVLFFYRSIAAKAKGKSLSDVYTRKRIIASFVVLPVLCGVVAFAIAWLVPQAKDCIPVAVLGVLLLGNLVLIPLNRV